MSSVCVSTSCGRYFAALLARRCCDIGGVQKKTTISNLHSGSCVVQGFFSGLERIFLGRPWLPHGLCSAAETPSKERVAWSEMHLQLRGKKHRNQLLGLFAQGSSDIPKMGSEGKRHQNAEKKHRVSGSLRVEQIRSFEVGPDCQFQSSNYQPLVSNPKSFVST